MMIKIINILNPQQIPREELSRVKKKRIRIFVLFVKSSLIDPVLKQAHELGLVGPEYLWISGSSVVDDLVRSFLWLFDASL